MTSRLISIGSIDRQRMEPLERRALLSATLANGVLTITGSAVNEHIEVDINDDRTTIEVNIEKLGGGGGADLEPTRTFNPADVTRIIVDAQDGDDDVAIDEDLTLSTEVRGGNGDDTLSGGSGSDYLYGGDGEDTLLGREGNDTLSGGASKNLLYGGDGSDRLTGSSGHDVMRGEGGDDRLYGGGGDDELDGGGNKDRVYGEAGNDLVYGSGAVDRLYGGDGDDSLFGGSGEDYLFGDAGNDSGQRQPGDALTSIEVDL